VQKVFSISGRVKIGLGRGAYFMGQKEYKAQFIKKLGIDPYHGTLNVKLSPANVLLLGKIRKRKGILVKGFRRDGKSFGDVLCYHADMSGIKCALVMPKKSTHTQVAEIISSQMLRAKLKLRDGSRVTVSVKA